MYVPLQTPRPQERCALQWPVHRSRVWKGRPSTKAASGPGSKWTPSARTGGSVRYWRAHGPGCARRNIRTTSGTSCSRSPLPCGRVRVGRGAGVEVAGIAGFPVVAGTDEALAPFRDVQSTVLVDDLDGLHGLLDSQGGEILSGPDQVPTGRNATVRHPGGVVIEYVEHTA